MAIVYEDYAGIVRCNGCHAELLCDENGDVPNVCPTCKEPLNWSMFDKMVGTDFQQCGKLRLSLSKEEITEKVKEILTDRGCYDIVVHEVFSYPLYANVHVSYKWRLNAWEKTVSMTNKMLVNCNGRYELY